MKSERSLRDLIAERNIREIHPGTKPSVDFIHKILEDAYDSGLGYDVRDLRTDILTFAMKSTNHAETCIKLVQTMKFVGKDNMPEMKSASDTPLIFFDVEVYPNLFVVCWKAEDSDTVVRMINPSPQDIEPYLSRSLSGLTIGDTIIIFCMPDISDTQTRSFTTLVSV